MRRKVDLTNSQFGFWTVLEKCPNRSRFGEVLWKCRCRCGTVADVKGGNLMRGASKSCGCVKSWATHNMTGLPTFKSWESMKQRCINHNSPDYPAYGGRGIGVCERWVNSFDNFLSDMGIRPANKTLDRIDVNGDYEPSNCRWATRKEQERNKRKTITVVALGRALTANEWAEISGLSSRVILERIKAGWPPDIAVSKPNRKKPI